MVLDKIEQKITKKRVLYILLLFIIAVGIIIAVFNSSITDDAYISFRYAKNLIHDKGLVFNEGEYVEGYSNILWLLVISAFMRVGFEPTIVSKFLGILFFAFNILLVYNISAYVFRKSRYRQITALLITLAFTLNPSVTYFATGGLEHSLFIFLLLVSSCLLFIVKKPIYANLVFFLLILTRNEGLLFFTLANIIFYFENKKEKKVVKEILASIILILVMISIYEAWRFVYYGSLLPNVFYVKATVTSINDGLNYIAWYFVSYPILFLLGLGILYNMLFSKGIVKYYSVSSILYILYLIKIGGDFMAYRLVTQVFAFMLISGAFGFASFLKRFVTNKKIKAILISVIIVFGVIPLYKGEVYSEVSLDAKILDIQKNSNWEDVGKKLKQENMPEGTRIAITAAGAIPYYSELYTLDMLGLNDNVISKKQENEGRPGHRKQADFEYLVEKKVNFVIGHPQTLSCNEGCKKNLMGNTWFLPKEVMQQQRVFLKLNETDCFRMFYLIKEQRIDDYLKNNKDFMICRTNNLE